MAIIIPITDAADPRLEPFRDIRERDLVGRQGRFMAEGETVLRVLLEADRFVIETILLSERVARGGRPWLDAVQAETPVLMASDEVIERISGFAVHRGILAIGRRRGNADAVGIIAGLPERAMVVVCVGLANHDNMGGIFRSAAAFGAAAVLCDETCCDPLYRKAIRVSVGGVFRTPFARGGDAREIVRALKDAGFSCLALSPSGRTDLHRLAAPARTALVLGAEGPGLPAAVMAEMETARIAMGDTMDSLNVSVSAGIALHHLFNR